VGVGQRVARAAMYAMPSPPALIRRGRRSLVPPPHMPVLADDRGSPKDPCCPRTGCPATFASPGGGPGHSAGEPPPVAGRGSLATCWDVEPIPGSANTEGGGIPRLVLPLDVALTAPGIRGHFALLPDAPGKALWWCARCGKSWRAPNETSTCPHGCAPAAHTPRRGHQT